VTTTATLEESNAALRSAVETRLSGKTTVEMSPMVASLHGCKPALEAATAALSGGCCEGAKPRCHEESSTYSEWTPPDYSRREEAVAGFKRLVEDARPAREARAARASVHPSSQAFYDACDSLKAMHRAKSADYGSAHDPLANIRNGAEFVGVEPWRAAMVRLSDKVTRLATYNRTGTLLHEGVDDTLLDLASYALLCLVLHRESRRD
jgi:hypothetical protein